MKLCTHVKNCFYSDSTFSKSAIKVPCNLSGQACHAEDQFGNFGVTLRIHIILFSRRVFVYRCDTASSSR